MKKIVFLLLLNTTLVSCALEEKHPNSTTNVNPQQNNYATEHNNTNNKTSSYNGYVPKDDLEQKYFDAIYDYSTWNSFRSKFTYLEDLKGDDDIPLELYNNSRFIIEPYQLHQDYHSIYFRNDNIEVYATEDAAYENQHYTTWGKVEDHSIYIKNPLPIRSDLYYALISGSEGVVAENPSKISFNIAKQNWEALYKKVQLAYFHNLINEDTSSTDGIEDLLESLENIEGFLVEMTLENNKLSKINITISFNRKDVKTVDQLLFSDEYFEINAIDLIEIPSEVIEESRLTDG